MSKIEMSKIEMSKIEMSKIRWNPKAMPGDEMTD